MKCRLGVYSHRIEKIGDRIYVGMVLVAEFIEEEEHTGKCIAVHVNKIIG
jgi:hypothetical protein